MRLTLPRLNAAYIVGAARTPVGKFNGALKSVSAIDLGITAAKAAVQRSKVPADQIDEFLFGQVLTANSGQAPARQVVIKGGFPESVEATTINKVCSSGLKTVALAAQAIKAGDRNVIVAGGMESMSNTPTTPVEVLFSATRSSRTPSSRTVSGTPTTTSTWATAARTPTSETASPESSRTSTPSSPTDGPTSPSRTAPSRTRLSPLRSRPERAP